MNGPGTYRSAAFTPTAAGTYYWTATLWTPAGEPLIQQECGAQDETTSVTPSPAPSPVTPAGNGSVDGLAATGSQTLPPLGFAIALLMVGVTFVSVQLVGRRAP